VAEPLFKNFNTFIFACGLSRLPNMQKVPGSIPGKNFFYFFFYVLFCFVVVLGVFVVLVVLVVVLGADTLIRKLH
jgi:hypothetical protein